MWRDKGRATVLRTYNPIHITPTCTHRHTQTQWLVTSSLHLQQCASLLPLFPSLMNIAKPLNSPESFFIIF